MLLCVLPALTHSTDPFRKKKKKRWSLNLEPLFLHRYETTKLLESAALIVPLCSSHPVLLQSGQRLVDAVHEFVDVFKVFGHLGRQHHVDDGLS